MRVLLYILIDLRGMCHGWKQSVFVLKYVSNNCKYILEGLILIINIFVLRLNIVSN